GAVGIGPVAAFAPPAGLRTPASAHIFKPPVQFLDFHRDAVSAHHDGALGHGKAVGEDRHLVVLGGIELDDGAAAEPQHLVDGHGGSAEHHLDIENNLVERGHVDSLRSGATPRGQHRHGYEVVNVRGSMTVGLTPSEAPVEWRVSEGLVAYPDALAAMEARAVAIAEGTAPELVWLLEHPPLYTAGTSARPEELIAARFPVHPAGRGGQLTYHGPGQRVVYLMLDLKRRGPDVRRFVATLEEWIIRTLAGFGVTGERRDDRIGVWVRRPEKGISHEDKIAAIGVRIKRWVTLHGLAINMHCDLSPFSGI